MASVTVYSGIEHYAVNDVSGDVARVDIEGRRHYGGKCKKKLYSSSTTYNGKMTHRKQQK